MKKFPKEYPEEFHVFRKLNTPIKIQDFLETLPINFERGGDTCRSPLMTIRTGKAHCMEGALFAAAALWYHGRPPLLMDLKVGRGDESHVVALFNEHGCWGAIGKTNHAVLRYRDPVYRTLHELAMSFFHEYFLDNGRKTLKSYSKPFDLRRYKGDWLTNKKHLWKLIDVLDRSPHIPIIPRGTKLRRADPIERKAGKLVRWRQ